jgi:hypothetical protein
MKKFLVLSGMTLALAASSMFAGTFTSGPITAGPTTFNYGNGSPQPTVPLTFAQLNLCSGCTLTSIEFDYSVLLNTNYSVTNTSGSSAHYSVNTAADVQLENSTSTVAFNEVFPSHTTNLTIAGGATSTGTDSATSSATSIFNGSGALVSYNGGGTVSNPINVSLFLGSGNITLDAIGNFTGGIGGTSFTGTVGGTGTETASIIYTYNTPSSTPEPATMTLFGSALLGIGFFARKRTKKS